jgi:uncharacterized protein YegJ (DUF2314 family)
MARGRAVGLLETMDDNKMEQLVEFPINLKGNTLDLVITKIPGRVTNIVEVRRIGENCQIVIVTKLSVGQKVEDEKELISDWQLAN